MRPFPGFPASFKLWGPRKARPVFAFLCSCASAPDPPQPASVLAGAGPAARRSGLRRGVGRVRLRAARTRTPGAVRRRRALAAVWTRPVPPSTARYTRTPRRNPAPARPPRARPTAGVAGTRRGYDQARRSVIAIAAPPDVPLSEE